MKYLRVNICDESLMIMLKDYYPKANDKTLKAKLKAIRSLFQDI
jgi:hypothetical protein